MLPFIRSDLAKFTAYKPHPGSDSKEPLTTQLDRLDTNESPYDLPFELKEKLAVEYQQLIETNRYPDGGHEKLKNAIAEYVSHSAELSPSLFTKLNISVGSGSDELIRSILIATCLGGEGSILVAQPTFSMYGILAQTLGIPVVAVARNQDNFEIDLKAAQLAIKNTQNPPIRTVFVVHPNSPTGNALSAAELTWLRSLSEDILVVIDEAYFEFSQTSLVGELTHHPNWIVLRTFSKAFRLAAHRLGYALAHPELIAILEKVRLPYNLPSFSIAAGLMVLKNRQLLDSMEETLNERAKLFEALSQNPELQVWNSAANFIFLRPKPRNSDKKEFYLKNLTQKLRISGTLVREINHGLRITIGNPSENIRTLKSLETILANLESDLSTQ
jgi:histidinol-phosphate aminotransferase